MARMLVVVLGALAAASLLAAAVGTGAQAQNPKLFGTVGPGFSIVLRDAQGSRVSKLDPGTYDVDVEDLADEHNFHLSGPGVNRSTSVEGTGKATWTVTFTDGNYTFVCDLHPTSMRGTFTVGNPPTTTPSGGAVTAKTKLVLTSGPDFTITLRTASGGAVKTMKLGTYTMTVRDRARIHNAHVVAPGFNRKTTIPFVGSQTWKIKLAKAGTLRFLCDPHVFQGMKGSAKIVR